jgi:putative tricarboxylic transport membrane protein
MLKHNLRHLVFSAVIGILSAETAFAWQPTRPVEFVVTAGAGGGTDIFARTIQTIVQKHNLLPQPIVVTIKGGGSGAEGYGYTKAALGDVHKLVFGTHNSYALPLGSKVGFTHNDLTPLAAMAFDEFILWTNAEGPIKDVKSFIEAVKAKDGKWKMAGAQSKDSDELVTKLAEKAIGTKLIYVPFKSGAEADVQLTGGHVDSHVNNPSESIGSWRAGKVRALCVFNVKALPAGPKVTDTQGWADIPTCKSQGLGVDRYQQPRLVMMPGGVPPEVASYYIDVLEKVSKTPEWKDYIDKSAQTSEFVGGAAFKTFVTDDHARFQTIFAEQGWLAK